MTPLLWLGLIVCLTGNMLLYATAWMLWADEGWLSLVSAISYSVVLWLGWRSGGTSWLEVTVRVAHDGPAPNSTSPVAR